MVQPDGKQANKSSLLTHADAYLSMMQRLMLLYFKLEYDYENERMFDRIYHLLEETKQKDAEYTELLYEDLLTIHEKKGE